MPQTVKEVFACWKGKLNCQRDLGPAPLCIMWAKHSTEAKNGCQERRERNNHTLNGVELTGNLLKAFSYVLYLSGCMHWEVYTSILL